MKDELKKEIPLERDKLITDNMGLIYYCLRSFSIPSTSAVYDDFFSAAQYGLVKASNSFDPNKNCTFATFAIRCIKNEILMYLRKEKKHVYVASLEEPISMKDIGKIGDVHLEDIIASPDSDFTEVLELNETFSILMEISFNTLSINQQLVLYYWLGNISQKKIGERLHFSQSYVSRILKNSCQKIRRVFESSSNIEKKIFFTIKKDSCYEIRFPIFNATLRDNIYLSIRNTFTEEYSLLEKDNFLVAQINLLHNPFLAIAHFIEQFHPFYL